MVVVPARATPRSLAINLFISNELTHHGHHSWTVHTTQTSSNFYKILSVQINFGVIDFYSEVKVCILWRYYKECLGSSSRSSPLGAHGKIHIHVGEAACRR